MPAIGDRVVFEGNKVGGARREGELVAVDGRLVRVRWHDGSESTLFPGAGAMRVIAKRGSRPAAAAQMKKARATAAGRAAKGAAKRRSTKSAPKKVAKAKRR